MPRSKNKKILFYLFLFLIIGTLNNKNLSNLNFSKIAVINVTGLSEEINLELKNSLNSLMVNNIFFLDKLKIKEILNSNNLIQKYKVHKKYPSTLNIKLEKTEFLAQIKKDNEFFVLGANNKLIKMNDVEKDIPFIFGDFKINDFILFKKSIDESEFNFKDINNLFFFKSGRWDIELKNGILLKLPKKNLKRSLDLVVKFMKIKHKNKIDTIDLRQNNQIITNGN